MGHLLYLLGSVSRKSLDMYERESQKIGKASFAFAWILDETEEERARGITMDVAVHSFRSPRRRWTLLDAPGHKDFMSQMIQAAFLVISHDEQERKHVLCIPCHFISCSRLTWPSL